MGKVVAHKSWRSKLEKDQPRKVVEMPPERASRLGSGRVLIPKPMDVDEVVRTVGKGELITVNQIRAKLAKAFEADCTCPIVTGIFLWISGNTAAEDEAAGKKRVTPWWRVVMEDGSLRIKSPGGVEAQAKRLRAEGHKIVSGKTAKRPMRVEGFEGRLVRS